MRGEFGEGGLDIFWIESTRDLQGAFTVKNKALFDENAFPVAGEEDCNSSNPKDPAMLTIPPPSFGRPPTRIFSKPPCGEGVGGVCLEFGLRARPLYRGKKDPFRRRRLNSVLLPPS